MHIFVTYVVVIELLITFVILYTTNKKSSMYIFYFEIVKSAESLKSITEKPS